MFNKVRFSDWLIVLLIVLVTVLGSYFYVNVQAFNRLWQSIYPLRAKMALTHVQCSQGSPAWMEAALRLATKVHRAPANQVAYLTPAGKLYYCESGYVGMPWFSAKVMPESRFRFASVTKLWTSDAILQLVNQGRLSLDTPLVTLLPELQTPKDARIKQITVGHLLLHQGGFDRTSIFGTDMFSQNREEICPRYLPQLVNINLNFNPGSKTSYSNLGYCLLGEVLARVYEKNYVSFIEKQYEIDQDGLKFIAQEPLSDEVTYNYEEKSLIGIANIYTAFNYADLASVAGLSGSASGLARQVGLMLHDGLNITSQPIQQNCDLTQLRSCYGYAMFPYRQAPNKPLVFFRDGTLPGLLSIVMVDSQGGVVTLLSNGNSTDHDADIMKLFLYKRVLGS